jgi:asparagine synthase (glutamine-hydrolysing)
MARDAFKDEVPRQILDRESKGSITSFILRVIRDATPFLKELLLDGVLVRERIVGTRELNLYFDELQPIRMEQIFPLLACVTAEVWARSWVTPVSRALDVSAHLP